MNKTTASNTDTKTTTKPPLVGQCETFTWTATPEGAAARQCPKTGIRIAEMGPRGRIRHRTLCLDHGFVPGLTPPVGREHAELHLSQQIRDLIATVARGEVPIDPALEKQSRERAIRYGLPASVAVATTRVLAAVDMETRNLISRPVGDLVNAALVELAAVRSELKDARAARAAAEARVPATFWQAIRLGLATWWKGAR